MKAIILTVGDELLIGQVVDTNSAWMGSQLYELGIQVLAIESVPDHPIQLESAIRRSAKVADVILITGGLGPTKDDITKKVLCNVMDCGLYFSDATYNRIQRMFEKRGIPMRDAHKEQCMMPDKAEILTNARGTAPGMWFDWKEAILVSMPGVPHEMKYLMTKEVLPRLDQMSDVTLAKRTVRTVGIPESSLASMVEPLIENHDVSIAYLPSRGQVRLRLYTNGTADSLDAQQKKVDAVAASVAEEIGLPFFGYDEATLESVLGEMLVDRGLTVATAESCTGGFIAHRLTSIPGASRYFVGSCVAYSNEIKMRQLGVLADTLDAYGAVSIEVTQEMLQGVLKLMNAKVGIAVSGIAGPDGGSSAKPVGTICLTVGSQEHQVSKKIVVGKDRMINIEYATVFGLNMLRKFLLAD
ncbi:MAG: competence/damage-inducible protein A [Saprospiraceae bacterium]|nr:competence/damage-inducible protein A [Saprospiraceae bacterium]